jgi:hypothetical protein
MLSPLSVWRGAMNIGAATLVLSSVQPATQVLNQVGLTSDPVAFDQALDSVPLAHAVLTASDDVVQALVGALGVQPVPPGGGVGPDLQSNGTLEFSQ